MTEKRATTIEQQIQLLKDRGMIIADENKAKEILMDKGYYRLGFYWFPFEITYPHKDGRNHHFRSGTNFKDAVSLYYFDRNLRSILADYLYRIEINFRTNIIYTVSNYYNTDPFWFSKSDIVKQPFIDSLPASYSNIKINNAIRYHHKRHKTDLYAPAWKTLEYMTLGEIIKLYKCLNDDDLRHKIADRYHVRNIKIMDSYLTNIRLLRNLCAHAHNIFDLRLNVSLLQGPIDKMDEHHHDLVGCLLVIHYILSSISKNRADEMKHRIYDLVENENNSNIRYIIDYIKDFCE